MMLKQQDCIETPFEVDLRFLSSSTRGLNIIPVDFVAKMIYQASTLNDNNESYHLASKNETPHDLCANIMLQTVQIKGARSVNTMPTNLNRFESLYYKITAHSIPYIDDKHEILFSILGMEELCNKSKIILPIVDENNFVKLMIYARKKNFGLY